MENWFIQGNHMLQSDAHGKKIETLLSVPDLPCSHLSPKYNPRYKSSKAMFSLHAIKNKINAEKEKKERKETRVTWKLLGWILPL